MIRRILTTVLIVLPVVLMTAGLRAEDLRSEPERATGTTTPALAVASRHMVVAAHPDAAAAGREILRQGGSAVDAAIATQLVLGLVEPQSSGLGGGAFLLHWNATSREVKTYDGRETAPAAATGDRFIVDGKSMPFDDAVRSGLSVGVPGVMRMLELAHARHGSLPWKALFEPAIRLAEQGFRVSPRLSKLLAADGPERFAQAARSYFFDAQGRAHAPGDVLKNPDYAQTLKDLADKGASAIHEGRIAADIVSAVTHAPGRAGDMTLGDLGGYTAKERVPLCFAYRFRRLCSMAPPSSGGLTVAQVLKLIEPLDAVEGADARMSAKALHLIGEAEKLAFADRNRYIADPDFVPAPTGLLDDAYITDRRKLIDMRAARGDVVPGLPPGLSSRSFGVDKTHEAAGTSHISIVDDKGNAVAMTTTIEGAFGSHLWASGFLLNNELTDFSFAPNDEQGAPIANAVAGGKRPRSSMAPTFVFDPQGDLEIVTGSPGGPRIILYVVKTLVAMLDWGLDAQQAAALTNFGSQGGAFEIEHRLAALWPALLLRTYGHEVSSGDMTSGVNTILVRGARLKGGTDPRREGAALGD